MNDELREMVKFDCEYEDRITKIQDLDSKLEKAFTKKFVEYDYIMEFIDLFQAQTNIVTDKISTNKQIGLEYRRIRELCNIKNATINFKQYMFIILEVIKLNDIIEHQDIDSIFSQLKITLELFKNFKKEDLDLDKYICRIIKQKTESCFLKVQSNLVNDIKILGYPITAKLNHFFVEERLENFKTTFSICLDIFKINNMIQETNVDPLVDILFTPIKRRYLYHFQSSKTTNNIYKPEWGFNQLLTWLELNYEFCEKYIFGLIKDLGLLAAFKFTHRLQDLIYDSFFVRKSEYLSTQLALLNLIDQLFIFVDKFNKKEREWSIQECERVLDLISQTKNNEIYSKWFEYQNKIITNQITEYLTNFRHQFDVQSQKFLAESDSISLHVISMLVPFLKKISITNIPELKISLLSSVLSIYENVMDILFLNILHLNKFDWLPMSRVFLQINNIDGVNKFIFDIKLQPWYILLRNEASSMETFDYHDRILKRYKNKIKNIVESITQLFIDHLNMISKRPYRFDALSDINNLCSIFREIKILYNYIYQTLTELSTEFSSIINFKIDRFLNHDFLMNLSDKETIYELNSILDMLETCIHGRKLSDVFPLFSEKVESTSTKTIT